MQSWRWWWTQSRLTIVHQRSAPIYDESGSEFALSLHKHDLQTKTKQTHTKSIPIRTWIECSMELCLRTTRDCECAVALVTSRQVSIFRHHKLPPQLIVNHCGHRLDLSTPHKGHLQLLSPCQPNVEPLRNQWTFRCTIQLECKLIWIHWLHDHCSDSKLYGHPGLAKTDIEQACSSWPSAHEFMLDKGHRHGSVVFVYGHPRHSMNCVHINCKARLSVEKQC